MMTVHARPPESEAKILVIGFGNTLRRDDGVGQHVAAAISARDLPGLTSLAVHQLTPELAAPLSRAELAILIDARLSQSREVEVLSVEPWETGGMSGHVSNPRSLLSLTQTLYGRYPRTWLVSVPVEDVSLGEGLSAIAECGAKEAVDRITLLIEAEAFYRRSTRGADGCELAPPSAPG
jgi:hydrogenase maturation protease